MAAEAIQKSEKELTKGALEDQLKPDEDSDFKWATTEISKSWRFLLNGTTDFVVKPTSITYIEPDESINSLLGTIVTDGKGVQLLNTVARVYDKKLAVKQDSLIYAVAFCSCSEKPEVRGRAYELMFEVCSQSDHFLAFIDFREKICKKLRGTSGWSKGHRNAVNKWYHHKSAIEIARTVIESPKHNRWSHKDVLRLAHVVPTNENEKILFSFIILGLKKTLETFKNESEDGDDQKLLKFLEEVSTVRGAQDVSNALPSIEKWSLSWSFVPCHLYKDRKLWCEMVSRMPLNVMVQNTCRMAKMKIFDKQSEVTDAFCGRCKDEKQVMESGIHPYQIMAQKESYRNAMNDPKRKPRWKINEKVLNALNEALLLAMKNNLTSTGKRYFITIDASDSMKAHTASQNDVQCRVAAACMALCIAKAEQKVIVKAFSKELVDIEISETTKIEDIVKKLEETPLGGTDCSRPIIMAKTKKIKTDVFIVFTDKEMWSGKTSPSEALRQYRKAVKIPAKLIVVALNPNSGTTEKKAADSEDRGMIDIHGFSTSTPKMISNFATYPY